MGKKTLFFSMLFATFSLFTANSYAGWELYDNFNSGSSIDSTKWTSKDTSGTISIENQKAKFVHAIGHPNDSLYLLCAQSPETITGIKATVMVDSCTGDVRTRLAAYLASLEENHVWSGIQLQPSMDRIYTSTGLEGPSPNYEWVMNLHYAQYRQPMTITGKTFTVSMLYEEGKITYEVLDHGKIVFVNDSSESPPTDFFRAIGTRSSNGDGPCTVYFDDVYVFRP